MGNAYLESYTSEKVYIRAGPEFGEREGHTLLISKAIYGLRSSGARWHDRFFDIMRDMGFFPCKMEPDAWMRAKDDHYEYIAVYVDDLVIASKEPNAIIKALESPPNNLKLKGTGPIKFHLGCDYTRDEDGTLCISPKSYIERFIASFERLFGSKPSRKVRSPLEKGDHPEIDFSEELNEKDTKIYQSLVGAFQWLVSLGRFDIATATMTMSSFRAAPRKGHLERLKRMCAYIYNYKHFALRVRTQEPDYSSLEVPEYDWARQVYGDVKEDIPDDIPEALGKPVVHTCWKDANLYHCYATGRAVAGNIHALNGTIVDTTSKKLKTVDTATYGSEFVAARIAIDQIIDMRNTLRYLGVEVKGKTHLFGDNESVVTSATIPHSGLNKRHNALSYHRVREVIAAKFVAFIHIPGAINPSDILSKHWGYSDVWPSLQAIFHYSGDTADLLEKERDAPNGESKG